MTEASLNQANKLGSRTEDKGGIVTLITQVTVYGFRNKSVLKSKKEKIKLNIQAVNTCDLQINRQ